MFEFHLKSETIPELDSLDVNRAIKLSVKRLPGEQAADEGSGDFAFQCLDAGYLILVEAVYPLSPSPSVIPRQKHFGPGGCAIVYR